MTETCSYHRLTRFLTSHPFRHPKMLMALLMFAVLAGTTLLPAQAMAKVQYRWTQLTHYKHKHKGHKDDLQQAAVLVRAIIDAQDNCPSIQLTSRDRHHTVNSKKKMVIRQSYITAHHFDTIKVCETRITPSDTSHNGIKVTIDNDNENTMTIPDISKGIPLQQMMVFGDTGCRNAKGKTQKKDVQLGCKSTGTTLTDHWPFPQVMKNMNKSLSNKNKPVIIYQGDDRLFDPMTKNGKNDIWTRRHNKIGGWKSEVFDPLHDSTLLNKALWIFMRGNHENCTSQPHENGKPNKQGETGEGWLYFFGNKYENGKEVSHQSRCKALFEKEKIDVIQPYALDFIRELETGIPGNIAQLRLVILDTSHKILQDKVLAAKKEMSNKKFKAYNNGYVKYSEALINHYSKLFKGKIKNFITDGAHAHKEIWLTSHMAFFSLNGKHLKYVTHWVWDALGRSGQRETLSPMITLALGSHLHQFQVVNTNRIDGDYDRPLQIVLGNGGVSLSGGKSHDLGKEYFSLQNATWQSNPKKFKKKATNQSEEWAVFRRLDFGFLDIQVQETNNQTQTIYTPHFLNGESSCKQITSKEGVFTFDCSQLPGKGFK